MEFLEREFKYLNDAVTFLQFKVREIDNLNSHRFWDKWLLFVPFCKKLWCLPLLPFSL